MSKWSLSRTFPLLAVAIIVATMPADAKPRDLSLFPLRVHIFESEWKPSAVGGSGTGRANLIDGQDVRGFDFSYFCPINYMKSIGTQAYAARWKKPDKKIEIVGSKVGDQDKSDTCEFNVTMHDFVYDLQNGNLSTFTQEQYKVRNGMALPKTAVVDADSSHYPLRLSVLEIAWNPPLNGTRSASGRGNLRSSISISSVDFTTDCNAAFPVNAEGRFYAGQWAKEGSALALLLIADGHPMSCTLKTSVHTDVYVKDATGSIKAISAEDYRRTVLKQSAPIATPSPTVSQSTPGAPLASSSVHPSQEDQSAGTATQKEGSSDADPPSTSGVKETEEAPLGRKQDNPIVVVEQSKKPVAGPGALQAAALYRKGCDAGAAVSCRNLANLYGNGTGVTQDSGHAAGLYRKACNGGDPVSCANLGVMYSNGTGITQDYAQAATLYRKACDGNIGIACSNLALLYSNGTGVSQDYTQAVTLYNKACTQGVQAGCGNLGLMYANGTGVPRDYDHAISLYSKACDAGNMVGCSNLGTMYLNGTGLPRDSRRAAALYRRACDSSVSVSCYNLAIILEKSTGADQDYVQAAALYQKACDARIVSSCVNLGNMYDKGNGVAQDHTQAVSLYRKACDAGSAAGCNNLGVAFESQTGKQTSTNPAPK